MKLTISSLFHGNNKRKFEKSANLSSLFKTLKRKSSFRKPKQVLKVESNPFIEERSISDNVFFDSSDEPDLFFNQEINGFKFDSLGDNQSYLDIFDKICSEYLQNESESIQLSFISNKENINPSEYPLSKSKIPNYSFSSLNESNPNSTDSEILHKKFLSYGLASSTQSHSSYSINDVNTNSRYLSSPKSKRPLHSLPKSPLSSLYNDDVEDKSLFDCLSNVEWWDYSKLTLVSYNS